MLANLLVVDAQPLARDALAALLAQLLPAARIDLAGTAHEMLERLHRCPSPDLVLLDVAAAGPEGFAIMASLREGFPSLPVVVVSADADGASAQAWIELGASGFVPKSVRRETLAAVLQLVLDGEVTLMPVATRHAARNAAKRMSERELEVLRRLAGGASNKAIARRLDIAEATVRAHLSSVYRVLGVASRTQALVEAQRRGLLRHDLHS